MNHEDRLGVGSRVMHVLGDAKSPGTIVEITKAGYRVSWDERPKWHEDLVYPHEVRQMNGLDVMLELLP